MQQTHWYDTASGKHEAEIAFKVAGLSETEQNTGKQDLLTNEQIARMFKNSRELVDFLAGFVKGTSKTPYKRFAVSIAVRLLDPSKRDSS